MTLRMDEFSLPLGGMAAVQSGQSDFGLGVPFGVAPIGVAVPFSGI